MGFFSSKKTDMDNDNYHVTAMIGAPSGAGNGGEKSVVKVIRSRFVRLFLSAFHFGPM